jgi:hypothetical protein
MVPSAPVMVIGSAGARSPLPSAGVALTAATGAAGPEVVGGTAVVDSGMAAVDGVGPAGPVLVPAPDGGVLVRDAAPVGPSVEPVVQPAIATQQQRRDRSAE